MKYEYDRSSQLSDEWTDRIVKQIEREILYVEWIAMGLIGCGVSWGFMSDWRKGFFFDCFSFFLEFKAKKHLRFYYIDG